MRKILSAYIRCFKLVDNKKLYFVNQIEKISLSIINIVHVYFFSLVISSIFNLESYNFYKNVFISTIFTMIRVFLQIHSVKLEIYIRKNTNVAIKEKIIKEIFALPPYVVNMNYNGKIINIVMSDSLSPINFLYFINNYILKFITTVIIGFIMVQISWKLSICSVIIFPVVNLVNLVYGKKIRNGKIYVAEKNDTYIEFLKQILSYSLDITVNDFRGIIIDEHSKKMKEIKSLDLQLDILQTIIKNICYLIENLNMLFVIVFGAILVFSDKLSATYFYSFCSYSNKFNNSLSNFSAFNMDIQQLLVSVNRVLDLLQTLKNASEIEKGKKNIKLLCENITLEKIDLRFNDKYLFRDISLKILKGQIIVLSGRNGVGKTSLLKLVAKIYTPSEGKITYDDIDLKECNFNSVNKNLTFIFQNPNIYCLTVMENLNLGNCASRDEIVSLCKYFNIHKDILELPNGYETKIDGKIALSSGQEKKIQIIRGLLSDTPVLLLDEPLTCLDNNSQILLQKYIEEHSENKITIIISHIPFVGMIGREIIINNKSLFIK